MNVLFNYECRLIAKWHGWIYLLSAELLQTTGELVSHWHPRIGTKNSSNQNWQLAGDAIISCSCWMSALKQGTAIYFLKTSALWRHNHVQCRSEKITVAIYRSLMYGVLSWWSSVEMRSFLLKQWHISHVPLLITLISFENMKAKSAKIDIGDLS